MTINTLKSLQHVVLVISIDEMHFYLDGMLQ